MCKKLLILSLSVAVLFVFSAPIAPVDAGGKWWKRNVDWRIAGTIVQFIDINVPIIPPPDPPVPPFFESVGMHSLINLSALGAPGPAKITLLSRTTPVSPNDPFECPAEYPFGTLYFDKNDFIAMFPGQTLLFALVDEEKGGVLCIGDGETYFKVKMNINGGTGWLEGASGYLIGEGNGYPRYSTDVTLVGENGRVTGEIILPH